MKTGTTTSVFYWDYWDHLISEQNINATMSSVAKPACDHIIQLTNKHWSVGPVNIYLNWWECRCLFIIPWSVDIFIGLDVRLEPCKKKKKRFWCPTGTWMVVTVCLTTLWRSNGTKMPICLLNVALMDSDGVSLTRSSRHLMWILPICSYKVQTYFAKSKKTFFPLSMEMLSAYLV